MQGLAPHLEPDERRLILNCARLELSDSLRRDTEELLHRPLAWDAVMFFARQHSVMPLMYKHLKPFETTGLVPAEARQTLLRAYHRAAYQNRQFARAMEELLRVFHGQGIPTIVPKGFSLVELIYGNLGWRPLIDIQVLIPRERVDTALSILTEMGYAVRGRTALQPFQGWLTSRHHLVRPGSLKIDLLLQWELVNWPKMHAVDLRRIWRDAQPVHLAGRPTHIPSPHDLTLYLSMQPDRHGFLNVPAVHVEDPAELVFAPYANNSLVRYTDIYEVVRRYRDTIDWHFLIERAKQSGVEGALYASLLWTTKLLGPITEASVLERLRPPYPRSVRTWLFQALTQEPRRSASNSRAKSFVRAWWLGERKMSGVRAAKILHLLEFIFPRREEVRLRYRPASEAAATLIYLRHVSHALSRCAVGFLPWAYYRFIQPRLARPRSASAPAPRLGRQ